jgi:hypothetical protein
MRMRWVAASVVIVVAACGSSAAALAAPGSHSDRATPARCGPRSATTVASDRQARIYESGGNVYGCVTGRHTYLLGQTSSRTHPSHERVGPIALAGRDAAYGRALQGVDTLSMEVIVRRLDNGRTVHDVNAVKGPLGPEFFESVDALVVKADGAVAWMANGGSILAQESQTQVNRIDRRGEATLDSTAANVIRSLRLRGSRLSWRHGNALRTSILL